MEYDDNASPFNSIPPVVVAVVLLALGIEMVFWAGTNGYIGGPSAVGWRQEAVRDYAIAAPIFDWMLENGRWPLEHVKRFVTYAFVHQSFMQMVMFGVFTLALGKMVGELLGTIAFLAIFILSAICGALAFVLIAPTTGPLLGGFPAAYGLIGAYTMLLWTALAGTGDTQLKAFSLIAILMGLQLVFGLMFGLNTYWIADLAGFFAGFLLSFLVVPGALSRLLDKLRQR